MLNVHNSQHLVVKFSVPGLKGLSYKSTLDGIQANIPVACRESVRYNPKHVRLDTCDSFTTDVVTECLTQIFRFLVKHL